MLKGIKILLEWINGGSVLLESDLGTIHENRTAETTQAGKFEGEIVSNRRNAVETGLMLKARREEIGFSQKELAAMLPPALGMTQQRIAHYEAGTRAQYYYEITALTNALQLDDRDVMFN